MTNTKKIKIERMIQNFLTGILGTSRELLSFRAYLAGPKFQGSGNDYIHLHEIHALFSRIDDIQTATIDQHDKILGFNYEIGNKVVIRPQSCLAQSLHGKIGEVSARHLLAVSVNVTQPVYDVTINEHEMAYSIPESALRSIMGDTPESDTE